MDTIDFVKATTSGPDDLGPLKQLAEAGYGPSDVIAIAAKTEGNGCVNDFSRTLAASVWGEVVGTDTVTVFSGGTEGVLSPHVNFLLRRPAEEEPGATRGSLVARAGQTRVLAAGEIGRAAQTEAVRSATAELMEALWLAPADVQLVLVKCPLLTSSEIAECLSAGDPPVTTDPLASMGRSRAAAALGVALALGECTESAATAALEGTGAAWSSVASVSSGAELHDCKVLVVGTSDRAVGQVRAVHGVMRDALDAGTILELLHRVDSEGGEVLQVFAKAEPDPSGHVRGRRHTMLTDSDVAGTRHARAAVGGLLAGLVGDSAIYVSGGAEHQGPPGGGPVTVFYRVPACATTDA